MLLLRYNKNYNKYNYLAISLAHFEDYCSCSAPLLPNAYAAVFRALHKPVLILKFFNALGCFGMRAQKAEEFRLLGRTRGHPRHDVGKQ